MGNFISNQRGDTKDYGVLYRIRLRKEEGVTRMMDVEPIITWVHRYKAEGRNHYRILPVERVIGERNDPILTAADYEQMKKNLECLRKRLAAMGAPSGNERLSFVSRGGRPHLRLVGDLAEQIDKQLLVVGRNPVERLPDVAFADFHPRRASRTPRSVAVTHTMRRSVVRVRAMRPPAPSGRAAS